MADGGVPLHGDGKGEVDGAGEADLGEGEEDGDHVQVQLAQPYATIFANQRHYANYETVMRLLSCCQNPKSTTTTT